MSTQPITKRSITNKQTHYQVQSDGKIAYRTIVGVGWTAWEHVETIARGGIFQGAVGLYLRDDGRIGVLDRRGNLCVIEPDDDGRRYAAHVEREEPVPSPGPRPATTAGVPAGMYTGLVPNTAHAPCGRCGLDHPYWTKTFEGDGGAVCLPVLFTAALPSHDPTVAPTHGLQVMIAGMSEFFPGIVWREDGVTEKDDEARVDHLLRHRISTIPDAAGNAPTVFVRVVRQDRGLTDIPLDRIGEYQFDERGYLVVEGDRAPADQDPISGHELPSDSGEQGGPWREEWREEEVPTETATIRLGGPNQPEITFRLNLPREDIRVDAEFDPILRLVTRSPMTAAADLCRQALPKLVAAIIKLTNLPDGRGLDQSQVYTLLETAAISLHADADREETGEEPVGYVAHEHYLKDALTRAQNAPSGIIPGRPGQGVRS